MIVSFINAQDLFDPVMQSGAGAQGREQLAMFYLANGALSAISDNVFVATIFIHEIERPFSAGLLSREQFDALAVALNTGVNIPSIATPNGQAAFLFLLSSSLAPLIRLSYARMVWMALPYFVPTTAVGLMAVLGGFECLLEADLLPGGRTPADEQHRAETEYIEKRREPAANRAEPELRQKIDIALPGRERERMRDRNEHEPREHDDHGCRDGGIARASKCQAAAEIQAIEDLIARRDPHQHSSERYDLGSVLIGGLTNQRQEPGPGRRRGTLRSTPYSRPRA